MGGFVSETTPVRPTGRRRLVAVCTAGILSLGAFALGTGAQAAEPGTHSFTHPKTAAPQLPHLTVPKTGKAAKTPKASGVTQVATPAPHRYDVDSDNYDDQLFRIGNTLYNSLAHENAEIGATSEQFVDLLTPGDLDGVPGPEVLATTSGGQLQMFAPGNLTYGPSWAGNGWGVYNKLVAVDDLTGDGRADIVARDYSGGLFLYQGTGNGSAPFKAKVSIGAGWAQYDQLTGPGDIDGDGISDLVARDASGTLWLYRGTGSATKPFAGRTEIGTGWGQYNQLIGLGNGDTGSAHLWARAVDGSLYLYTPNGKGGFAARQSNGTGFNVDLIAGSGSIPYWGKKQLIGETPNGTLYFYATLDNGTFTPRVAGPNGGWAGDFQMTYANALTNSGLPSFLDRWEGVLYNVSDADYAQISTGWGGYNLVVGPGDLSGDGKGDLLGRDSSGKLYVFRGYGDGLRLAGRQLVGSGWNAYNAIVGAGDFSGDGRADIVARDASGTLYLYKGTGNAAKPFAAKVTIGTGWGQYTQLASPGDMDGDGRADLLAVNSAGTAYRYSATGTGQFKARVSIGSGWNAYKKLY